MRRERLTAARPTSPQRTFGYAAATSYLTCFAVLLSGCRTPLFVCNPVGPAAPPIVNVRFDDQRPKWERRYYTGGALHDVTFIPAERICPQPWEQFRERLAVYFERYGVEASSTTFDILSCRVVVKNVGRVNHVGAVLDASEYIGSTPEISYAMKQQNGYIDPSEAAKDDLEDELKGLAWVAGFYAAGLAAYEATRHVAHWLHLRPGHAGPPRKLPTRGYAAGTTFEMIGRLTITLPTGESKTLDVRQVNLIAGRSGVVTDTVKLAVTVGTDRAAERAVRDLLGLAPAIDETTPVIPAGYQPLTIQQATTAESLYGDRRPTSDTQAETRRLEQAEAARHQAFRP